MQKSGGELSHSVPARRAAAAQALAVAAMRRARRYCREASGSDGQSGCLRPSQALSLPAKACALAKTDRMESDGTRGSPGAPPFGMGRSAKKEARRLSSAE